MKKLIKIISIFYILAIPVLANAFESEKWNSVEGLKRLKTSKFNNDFYQLVNYYQPQINPLYCSVATGVMLLNALNSNDEIPSQKENEIKKPQAIGGGVSEFHSYSQLSFLNEKTDKIKKREIIQLKQPKEIKDGKEIYDAGLSLTDYANILTKAYDLKVELNYIDKNDEKLVKKFRDDLKKYLVEDKKFVVVNFDGQIINNKTKGHVSPVVAYDEESDSILVLDPALHKNTWYWVDLQSLYKAMNSKDGDSYRGYLIVSK